MKIRKLLSIVAVVACFSATAVFAAPEISNPGDDAGQKKMIDTKDKNELEDMRDEQQEFSKDPIKDMERRKEKVQSLLKEGKISKEKADEITKKLDEKIKKIKEFNKLPLEKKKEKLINDFKARIDKEVKDGRIPKEKADELLKEFTRRIEQWDGKGYPKFYNREMNHGKKPCKELDKDNKTDTQ